MIIKSKQLNEIWVKSEVEGGSRQKFNFSTHEDFFNI